MYRAYGALHFLRCEKIRRSALQGWTVEILSDRVGTFDRRFLFVARSTQLSRTTEDRGTRAFLLELDTAPERFLAALGMTSPGDFRQPVKLLPH